MSVKVMGQVWDLPLPPKEKFVLLALADHADHHGRKVYPSIATIARKVALSERQVQRYKSRLREKGYLVVERESTRYMPTIYRISTGVTEMTPLEAVRGDITGVSGVSPVSPEPSIEPSEVRLEALTALSEIQRRLSA